MQLHDLGEIGPQRIPDQTASLGQDLVQAIGPQCKLPEFGQDSLLPQRHPAVGLVYIVHRGTFHIELPALFLPGSESRLSNRFCNFLSLGFEKGAKAEEPLVIEGLRLMRHGRNQRWHGRPNEVRHGSTAVGQKPLRALQLPASSNSVAYSEQQACTDRGIDQGVGIRGYSGRLPKDAE